MNDNAAAIVLFALFLAFVGYVCWVASRSES